MSIKERAAGAYSSWMNADGPDAGIVISSRVRVARNLAGIPFPHLLDLEMSKKVIREVQAALENEEASGLLGNLALNGLEELEPLERQILVDKHLISPDLLQNFQSKAVAIRDDEVVSIMVNEEDHLRIQCLLSGLQLKEAWDIINKVDDGLEKKLRYAFSEKYGFLTSCPTNVGTGMRASVMLHLTALKLTKQITLGQSEEEIVNNLISITKQILAQELTARRVLHKERRDFIEDRVYRAFGALKYARLLSLEEAMRLFSSLRLGLGLKIISGVPDRLINELMVKIRPAFLIKSTGHDLSNYQGEVLRAGLIREELAGLT